MRPADTSAVTTASMGLLLLVQQENSLSPANMTNAARWISVGMWNVLIPYINARLNVSPEDHRRGHAPCMEAFLAFAVI